MPHILFGQYTWKIKADFPATSRYNSCGFAIGSKGYFVAGGTNTPNITYNDLWEYNPPINAWTQKANFIGQPRLQPVSFVIGNFAYVGTGWSDHFGTTQFNDFYKYDPLNNTWTTIANFPGAGRYSTTGISDGSYGYVGLGYGPLHNDFYKYDPLNNSWLQIANFPFSRQASVAFSINNAIFIACGNSINPYIASTDLWQYNSAANSWSQMANIPGLGRSAGIAFSINNKGYVGSGWDFINNDQALYSYDLGTNLWSAEQTWPAGGRTGASYFSIGNIGYAGLGVNFDTLPEIYHSDFWEFSPSNVGINDIPNEINFSISPSPSNGNFEINLSENLSSTQFEVFTTKGKKVFSKQVLPGENKMKVTIQNLSNGIYFYSLSEKGIRIKKGKLIIEK